MSSRFSAEQMRQYLRMYLVIGSVNCREEPVRVVKEALAGGATLVQFREKGPGALTGAPMLELALQIQVACRLAGVPFIVNDDIDLALTIGADGVHIGQDDALASVVRYQIGDRILGVSAHTVEEAKIATRQGADYLGIGPIYPTISKDDAHAVQGTGIIQEMRKQGIELPMVGIGGITPERVSDVITTGADGVAVISAITQATNVRKTVELINRKVNQASMGV
ncbi:thiamine phosphate synthase [Paenibacillus segetis]|uniref:Thiamine-phosphate synthase n=1 Tax=Paenibacillus segetis TaxID=1325360 RepID=A0ABQ1Y3R3_9BACL|nr:thiamine phosphate synthase [Paenibacillus segetis]GGH10931.1 thiamine-phosphate synthase [Paenibacillus segetis]